MSQDVFFKAATPVQISNRLNGKLLRYGSGNVDHIDEIVKIMGKQITDNAKELVYKELEKFADVTDRTKTDALMAIYAAGIGTTYADLCKKDSGKSVLTKEDIDGMAEDILSYMEAILPVLKEHFYSCYGHLWAEIK